MTFTGSLEILRGSAMTTPIALTIAGSDSSGGAGIQADLKTFAALGVYGASVITALTAQNTRGVSGIHQVPADFVTAQMDAVFSDLDVKAVKIGMVAQLATIDAIVAGLERWSPRHIVLDPVMVATSGDRLLAADAIEALADQTHSARLADHAEPAGGCRLARRTGRRERGRDRKPGQTAAGMGCPAVLIKGGHAQGAESIDYLVVATGAIALAAPRIATRNTHGTGCSLSSAIAAGLAKGEEMETAVRHAKAWVSSPRSRPPIGSVSATAMDRSIIFTGFIETSRTRRRFLLDERKVADLVERRCYSPFGIETSGSVSDEANGSSRRRESSSRRHGILLAARAWEVTL